VSAIRAVRCPHHDLFEIEVETYDGERFTLPQLVADRAAAIADRAAAIAALESLGDDLSMLAYSPEPADSREMARALAARLDRILGEL
jgi:hypothetical protein